MECTRNEGEARRQGEGDGGENWQACRQAGAAHDDSATGAEY